MREPAIGDLVVYHGPAGFAVARVDIVRDCSVTAFPWRQADRRWERGRSRIDRRNVLGALPRGSDPAPIADHLNVLRNFRDAERAAADAAFRERAEGLVRSLGGDA